MIDRLRTIRESLLIPASASDEERKRHLFNMLLGSMTWASLAIVLATLAVDVATGNNPSAIALLYVGSGTALVCNLLVYAVRRVSPRAARWLFVGGLLVAMTISDHPERVAAGYTSIAYVVPAIVASVLLYPWMSCAVAALSAAVISGFALTRGQAPPAAPLALLFLVASMTALLTYAWESTLKEWRATNRNLTLLNQAGHAFSSTLDLNQILVTVLDEIRRLLGLVACSIWLIDKATGEIVCEEATGTRSETVRGWRLQPGEGLAGWVTENGKSLVVGDAQEDTRYFQGVDHRTGLVTRSIVTVPLRTPKGIIGVLQMLDAEVNRFGRFDLELLESMAATAAIAIENARMYGEEQHRAEALTIALEQQRELDRLKSEFIQNVSHELRTPLALVRGHAELLESGILGELASDQQASVDVIARRVRMLDKLVGTLTTFLTVERRELKKEMVDLGDLVRALAPDFHVVAENAGVSLNVQVASDLPKVRGDRECLCQVLDNLMGNAFKFTPPGGEVIVNLQQEGVDVVLSVVDTGIGVPQDQLERIFDRFYQVDGSTTRRYGGTGLGLAVVKEIVEAHDGRVTAESRVEKGSAFHVALPGVVGG
ncbi:MAG: GAF domain-containing sensor histidine kinase [Anaerolineae bacterium]|nr:GAF domain-containing sensor histidine kinase [Anaerolineae bacterium]